MVEKQVFWVVLLCDWAICFPGFEDMYCLHEVITLKIKAVRFFETSERSYPTTQHNSPEDRSFLKTGLQIIKSFSAVSFPLRKATTFLLH
jgi:hypothetical protein